MYSHFTDISGDARYVAYAAVVSPSGDIVPVTAEVAAADEPAPGEDSEPDEPYVPV